MEVRTEADSNDDTECSDDDQPMQGCPVIVGKINSVRVENPSGPNTSRLMELLTSVHMMPPAHQGSGMLRM